MGCTYLATRPLFLGTVHRIRQDAQDFVTEMVAKGLILELDAAA